MLPRTPWALHKCYASEGATKYASRGRIVVITAPDPSRIHRRRVGYAPGGAFRRVRVPWVPIPGPAPVPAPPAWINRGPRDYPGRSPLHRGWVTRAKKETGRRGEASMHRAHYLPTDERARAAAALLAVVAALLLGWIRRKHRGGITPTSKRAGRRSTGCGSSRAGS
jgi:hypothetical protein